MVASFWENTVFICLHQNFNELIEMESIKEFSQSLNKFGQIDLSVLNLYKLHKYKIGQAHRVCLTEHPIFHRENLFRKSVFLTQTDINQPLAETSCISGTHRSASNVHEYKTKWFSVHAPTVFILYNIIHYVSSILYGPILCSLLLMKAKRGISKLYLKTIAIHIIYQRLF